MCSAGHDREAFSHAANEQVVGLAAAVALVILPDIGIGLGAVEIAAQNDVDHAGDGVGAVQNRSAILEHVNAFHSSGRDRGEVHRTAQAGPAHPTSPIHQHQRALRAKVAQIDQRLPVATIVVIAVQRRAIGADVLDDVAYRGLALCMDLLATQREHRL